jgi:hypothetical protein
MGRTDLRGGSFAMPLVPEVYTDWEELISEGVSFLPRKELPVAREGQEKGRME